ncbi:MAG: DUF4129 domain-containing protein [Chloroflexi bacterium]|nr:DUF4129 domain-containing protein [Chloroflexota bacterium]
MNSNRAWLRLLGLPLSLAAMQTCWVYPWALLFGLWLRPGEAAPLLAAGWVLLLLAGSHLAALALSLRGWPLRRAQTALVALGLVAVALAVRADYLGGVALADPAWLGALLQALATALPRPNAPSLAVALGILLWWRGLAQAQNSVTFERVERGFLMGLAALVGLALVALAFVPAAYAWLQQRTAVYFVGFFFLSLVLLALTRLNEVRAQARTAGKTLGVSPQWLAVLLATTTIILLLVVALAGLLSFDLIAAVAGPLLSPLGALLGLLFEGLVLLVGLLLTPLFYLILWLRQGAVPTPFQAPDNSWLEQLQKEGTQAVLAPEVAMIAKWVAAVVLVLLVVLLLARAVGRRREWVREADVDEERDSLWAWRTLGAALLAWLRSLWRRLPGASARGEAGSPAPRAVVASPLVLTIRQIYWQLLQLGARQGVARPRHATPYEHLGALRRRLGPADDLAAITEAYVGARYGPVAPTPDETEAVRARWRRLVAAAEEGMDEGSAREAPAQPSRPAQMEDTKE